MTRTYKHDFKKQSFGRILSLKEIVKSDPTAFVKTKAINHIVTFSS